MPSPARVAASAQGTLETNLLSMSGAAMAAINSAADNPRTYETPRPGICSAARHEAGVPSVKPIPISVRQMMVGAVTTTQAQAETHTHLG